MVSYLRYEDLNTSAGIIVQRRSSKTTFHENDSIAVFFQWKLVSQFSPSYVENITSQWPDCQNRGCAITSEYFISLQFTSFDQYWNETAIIGINAHLESRTLDIDPDMGIKTEFLSGFHSESTNTNVNYLSISPFILLCVVIHRRKNR